MATAKLRVVAALVLVAAAERSRAQSVRGVVTAADGTTPVPGAVVTLVDSLGIAVTRTLANDTGGYRLVAPRAGTYTLRTLRVGSRPSVAGPVVLLAGTTVERSLQTGGAVQLSAVMVSGKSDCRVRPDSSQQAFRAWEAARTALLATTLVASDGAVSMILRRRRESVDPDAQVLLHAEVTEHRALAGQSYQSVGAEVLARDGYVARDAVGLVYNAPDARVLLSEQFADAHCLRPAPSPPTGDAAHAGMVGVEFVPVRVVRDRADVTGTFWLDGASSELRSIEFRYVGVPPVAERAGAGGVVHLASLPGGRWIVRDWQLRMPVWETEEAPRASNPYSTSAPRMPRSRLTGIDIATGEVVLAAVRGRTAWDRRAEIYRSPYRTAARRQPVVVGTVTDSAGAPLFGVELTVTDADSDRTRISDLRGRFEPITLGAGAHAVHARKLGYGFAVQEVSLDGVDTLTLEVMLPKLPGITVLAEVQVMANRTPAWLAHFERHTQSNGFFLRPHELRKLPNGGLGDAIAARWPGAHVTRYLSFAWLQQRRGATSDPVYSQPGDPTDQNSPRGCWAQVVVNGVRIYSPRINRGDRVPDLNGFRLGDLAGVEFYASATTTPPEYSGSAADCGTIVLWTR